MNKNLFKLVLPLGIIALVTTFPGALILSIAVSVIFPESISVDGTTFLIMSVLNIIAIVAAIALAEFAHKNKLMTKRIVVGKILAYAALIISIVCSPIIFGIFFS